MYIQGLRIHVIASFQDHEGFDGIVLGKLGAQYHLEFTQCRDHPVKPAPTLEDLMVFYIPDKAEWENSCADLERASFRSVVSFNPYWDVDGRTYEDDDGYRIVLQNAEWRNVVLT
jgi:hypothetical protein